MNRFINMITALVFLPFLFSYGKPGLQNFSALKHNDFHKYKGKGVLLVYTGTSQSPVGVFAIGISMETDPAIGIRFEITVKRGINVMSHAAIFHKFSNPKQSIIYNFQSHTASVNYNTNPEFNTKLIGGLVAAADKEMIGKYSCTHLQKSDNKGDIIITKDDYWMANNLPGFQSIISALNKVNGESFFLINNSVFGWGGLVRWDHYEKNKKHNIESNAEINLIEANTDMDFPSTDFDPPKK
ncbi:MAG: hypothetical protein JST17_06340 [Bacteroidetes bacterium]|nr:hypothetical protein [Bacteroidota bacterium]MBS1929822.1 hypothetical protein [Bacteroidota bacterium]